MATPAPVVRVDPAVLRQAIGATLVLREGAMLTGRVAELNGRVGMLMLRGAPVLAELPPGVVRGQVLRLLVAGEEEGKVLLRVQPEEARPAPQAGPGGVPVPLTAFVPLPGGARFLVQEDEAGRAPGEPDETGTRRVSVRFEGAALGPVDLTLALDAGGEVSTSVRAAPAALEALRAAMGDLAGEVRLQPRASLGVDLRG